MAEFRAFATIFFPLRWHTKCFSFPVGQGCPLSSSSSSCLPVPPPISSSSPSSSSTLDVIPNHQQPSDYGLKPMKWSSHIVAATASHCRTWSVQLSNLNLIESPCTGSFWIDLVDERGRRLEPCVHLMIYFPPPVWIWWIPIGLMESANWLVRMWPRLIGNEAGVRGTRHSETETAIYEVLTATPLLYSFNLCRNCFRDECVIPCDAILNDAKVTRLFRSDCWFVRQQHHHRFN